MPQTPAEVSCPTGSSPCEVASSYILKLLFSGCLSLPSVSSCGCLWCRRLHTRWLQSVPADTALPHLGRGKVRPGDCCWQRRVWAEVKTRFKRTCACRSASARLLHTSFCSRVSGLEQSFLTHRITGATFLMVTCTLGSCARHDGLLGCFCARCSGLEISRGLKDPFV